MRRSFSAHTMDFIERLFEKVFHRRELATLRKQSEWMSRALTMPKQVEFTEYARRHWWDRERVRKIAMIAGDSYEVTVRKDDADNDLIPIRVLLGIGASFNGVFRGDHTIVVRTK